jgi:tartrate-resistant acid phosphatase type 5
LMPALCRYADAYIAGDDHVLEAYTDRCEGARPPLPLIVSGAGAKRRALNTRFIQHQLADNPELTQLWSKGSIWGFAHLRLQGDVMQVDFFTTPSDSSGRPVLERRLEFQRRSAP